MSGNLGQEHEWSDLISRVQQKREYANLSEDFIVMHATEYVRLHKKIRDKPRESQIAELTKHIRAKAREIYGVFQVPSLVKKRDTLDIEELLSSHLSTKERLPYYKNFYEKLFAIIGVPQKVLDVACGLNPIALYHYSSFNGELVCNELSQKDCIFLQQYFDKQNKNAKAIAFNAALQPEKLNVPVDVCFFLKALDTLETQNRNVTYTILDTVKAKYIVASFPLKNVKGEHMHRSYIPWFEKMLARKDISFQTLLFSGELVYICDTISK